uniref:TatD family hydrolase n=1 Tax=Thaumasiovibrio occultus TaxID=1891184 RepID=UPI000B355979|nr:TatD family hydrolase [Thaumasiovibrio occultus]
MLIDTHCHFDFAPFSPVDAHLARAAQAGVSRIVIPAIGEQNWQHLATLASQHDALYFGLGIHPVFMPEDPQTAVAALTAQLALAHPKCIAVGECGLDFFAATEYAARDVQVEVLTQQLRLANQFDLPVLLHCRKAFNELVQLLKRNPVQQAGIYHAFSGSYQQGCQLVDMGYKLGIGGTITYERAKKTRDAVRRLPLDALVLETDAPDMPLSGYQGDTNHPAQLPLIVTALAQIKSCTEVKIVEECRQSSLEVFALMR